MEDFIETRVLLAALNDDRETVAERIAEMTRTERRHLAAACRTLTEQIESYCQGCGEKLGHRGLNTLLLGTWHPECARERRATGISA